MQAGEPPGSPPEPDDFDRTRTAARRSAAARPDDDTVLGSRRRPQDSDQDRTLISARRTRAEAAAASEPPPADHGDPSGGRPRPERSAPRIQDPTAAPLARLPLPLPRLGRRTLLSPEEAARIRFEHGRAFALGTLAVMAGTLLLLGSLLWLLASLRF